MPEEKPKEPIKINAEDIIAGMQKTHKVEIKVDSKAPQKPKKVAGPSVEDLEAKLEKKMLKTRKPKDIVKEKPVLQAKPSKETKSDNAPFPPLTQILEENLQEEEDTESQKEHNVEMDAEAKRRKIIELRELISYVESYRNSIIEKKEGEDKKSRPNIDKITEFERKLEKADYRIKMLNKARLAFSSKDGKNSLAEEEWKEAKKVREEVHGRIAEELQEPIAFVKDYKMSLLESRNKEKDERKKTEIEGKVQKAEHRIEILENAHNFFLYPSEGNLLSEEDWKELKEVRRDVMKRMKEIKSENIVTAPRNSDKERKEDSSIETSIEKAENFEELLSIIKTTNGMQGSTHWIPQDELLGRMYLVKSGRITPDYLPRVLENKMEELLGNKKEIKASEKKEEKPPQINEAIQNLNKKEPEKVAPKAVKIPVVEKNPTKPKEEEAPVTKKVEEAPKPVNEEAQGKIEALRAEIQKIFIEKIREASALVSASRAPYNQQIEIKTRHDYTQTNRSSIMAKLFRKPSEKKPSENIDEYEKTKADYEKNLEILKNILTNDGLQEEALKKAFELGDLGLKILEEEKIKLQEIVQKILLAERKALIDAKGKGLPERDRRTVESLEALRNKSGVSPLLGLRPIIDINEKKDDAA